MWKPHDIADGFIREAEDLERYVRENKGRIQRKDPRSTSAQSMVDRCTGEADLLLAVANPDALRTRERLLEVLGRLQGDERTPNRWSGVVDAATYRIGWVTKCRELLQRYSTP